ncbi:MAG: hypothetical protein FJ087_13730 [Deltaproteobacteria bacterium]|nr:hypothetical protein [Deltaproteobacteria bacterium]
MRHVIPLAALLALAACGPKFIKDTKVEDTPQNREIAALVERYRVALEQRDVASLKELVSRTYFSNAGTTADPSDDYGYEQLEQKVLPELRESVKQVQYSISLRKIEVNKEKDHATAEFEYYYKVSYVDGGKDRWIAKSDFDRLDFAKEDGVWRIVAGL